MNDEQQGWWFDKAHQRKYIFEMAMDTMIQNPEVTPGHALSRAELLMNLYFAKHVNPVTRME